MQGRMLIFSMQVYDALWYRGIENQSPPAYSSLYLSYFLSFHTLKNNIFVKDFSRTMQARMFIFGMQVDDDLLYCCIVRLITSRLLLIHPFICPFFSFQTLMKCFVKDFLTTMHGRMLIFSMKVDDDLLYRGIENKSSPAYASVYLSNFSIHTLKNDIFCQRFLKNHAR